MSITQTYVLSALLLHSSKQEVTVEAIKKIFNYLNLSVDEKIAAQFVLPSYTYENLCSATTSTKEEIKPDEVEKVAEVVEEVSEEVDMDDFF